MSAYDWCADQVIGGVSGWRMPLLAELETTFRAEVPPETITADNWQGCHWVGNFGDACWWLAVWSDHPSIGYPAEFAPLTKDHRTEWIAADGSVRLGFVRCVRGTAEGTNNGV